MSDDSLFIAALDTETGEIVERPMTVDERNEYDTIRAAIDKANVDRARASQTGLVLAELAATDKWAARAVEDGEPMAPKRIAYRQQLRALLGTIAKSDDPASIEIPDPPENPKASK